MSDKSRRKLLKSIAAGSGAIVAGKSLPESWSKPVVNSVMLPSHAQTSQLEFGGTDLPTTRFALNDTNSDSMIADALISPAYAGAENGGGRADVCAIQTGDVLDVTIQTQQNNGRRRGNVSITEGSGTLLTTDYSSNCDVQDLPDDLLVWILDYDSGSGFTMAIDYRDDFPNSYQFSVYVPLGPCPNFQALDGPCVDGAGNGGGGGG